MAKRVVVQSTGDPTSDEFNAARAQGGGIQAGTQRDEYGNLVNHPSHMTPRRYDNPEGRKDYAYLLEQRNRVNASRRSRGLPDLPMPE